MGFLSLTTYNFRNLFNQEIELDAQEVFLVGKNGQGKTNMLEAIYLLCYGSSFRVNRDSLLRKHNTDEMWVRGTYSLSGESRNSIAVRLDREKKEIFFNSKRVSDRKQLIENIPCIVFSHDDIRFINGPPQRQRWFFNQTLCLYDLYFLDILRKYQKVLKMRNLRLKEQDYDEVEVYEIQLSHLGEEIQKKREDVIEEFNETFSQLFREISDVDGLIKIMYSPSWKNAENGEDIQKILASTRDRDVHYGTTTTGIHRDRILLLLEGKDFSHTASTGQLRLMSLALRVAQGIFFTSKTGRKPVLLLDDVLLELDRGKRRKFVSLLPDYEQAFFTFLPDENYQEYKRGETLIYRVDNGNIERDETC
jgi:DNA replication and repair protein RecF